MSHIAPPKLFYFNVDEIVEMVKTISIDLQDIDEHNSELIRALVVDVTDRILHFEVCDLPCSIEVLEVLNRLNISLVQWKSRINNILDFFQDKLTMLARVVDFYREDYIVHLQGKFIGGSNYQIELITMVPSRDFEAILRAEIEEALSKNEFVPYKYLRLIGRL